MDRLVVLVASGITTEGGRADEPRAFAEMLEVIVRRCPFVRPVRLGVAVLPARAPSRFFGGEEAVVDLLRRDLEDSDALAAGPLGVGVADGLFAAWLAARRSAIVQPSGTAAFLASFSLSVLGRPEMAQVLARLGVTTLGRLARLPEDRLIERFGEDGVHCRQVAAGEEGELRGLRDPGIEARLRALLEGEPPIAQPTFFGGTSLSAERALGSARRVQSWAGADAVLVARLFEGHDPGDRAALVPLGASGEAVLTATAPWPGGIPAPSPMTVLANRLPVVLRDPAGDPVGLTSSDLLTAVPGLVQVEGDRTHEVTAWAGPWPLATRWWSARRRRARLQVLTTAGVGLLLGAEAGSWWLLGRYD